MNLIDMFRALSIPYNAEGKILNATQIAEHPRFRVAVNADGNPVILISVEDITGPVLLKNRRLKYIKFEQNLACKIHEAGTTSSQFFTAITFLSTEVNLCNYFLQVAEVFVNAVSKLSSQKDIFERLNGFVEIFRVLSDPPSNTVQGLWSELFVIDNASDPIKLLRYWHNTPEEKFDFDAGEEKIEAKSTSNIERIHEFASEQLNPPVGTQVLIASILMRQADSGKTIVDLMNSIRLKIQGNEKLISKLYDVVSKTLGNSLETAFQIKYDYEYSKWSLRFYKHQDVSRVEAIYIPSEVSGVRYKSDLSSVNSVDITTLSKSESLFNGISTQ